jgi:hypothetical protein
MITNNFAPFLLLPILPFLPLPFHSTLFSYCFYSF